MKGTDLNAIATANEAAVKVANGVSFATVNIPSAGREPKIVGQAVTLPKDAVSVPLKGELGVYVIKVTSITEAEAPQNLASNKQNIKSTLVARAQNTAYQAILEQADINDERYKFYY